MLSKQEIQLIEDTYESPLEELHGDEYNLYVKSKGFYDVFFFAETFFGHWLYDEENKCHTSLTWFQREMLQDFVGQGNTLFIFPRGHGKSVIGRIATIWRIVYKQGDRLIFWMSEKMLSTNMSYIRDEFEYNLYIKLVYGKLVPERTREDQNKKWSGNALTFLNGVELIGVKKFGAVRGERADWIWTDDPQENKDVENKEIADKFEVHYKTSIIPLLKKGIGCVKMSGTIIGKHCLVKRIYDTGKEFKKYFHTAITNIKYEDGEIVGGDALWKEYWTIERLNKKRNEMMLSNGSDDAFKQEFLNIPLNLNMTPVFNKNYMHNILKPIWQEDGIQFYKERDVIFTDMCFGLDTAEGQPTSNYSTIIGRRQNGELVLQYKGRVSEQMLAMIMGNIFERGYRGIFAPERNKGLAFIEVAKREWWFDDWVYKQKKFDEFGKESTEYGWWTSAGSKKLMFSELNQMLFITSEKLKGNPVDKFILPNNQKLDKWETTAELASEYGEYYYDEKARITTDTKMGGHGDLVIADAICNQARKDIYTSGYPSLGSLGFS